MSDLNSDVPEIRQGYLDNLKYLIEIGKKLDELNPSEEIKKSIKGLESLVENYKI